MLIAGDVLAWRHLVDNLITSHAHGARGCPSSASSAAVTGQESSRARSHRRLRDNANVGYNGCDFNIHTHHT